MEEAGAGRSCPHKLLKERFAVRHRKKRKLLIALADSHIHTMMLTYYHLDHEERKKACPTVMKVAARMKDIHYKHNFKTELKIKIPTLYFSAWSAYQPVKKRLKRK
ncbi:MAG: hypothetical protein IJ784_10500 [Ruminiclostridium sp.]|nr:hypothetical protein [Ruminiclostridium sp.]